MSGQTVGNAVEQKKATPIDVMWTKRRHYDAVLPEHIEVEAFLSLAAGALYRDPKLMQAATKSPDSLINALMRCATLGHQPGTEEFYLTPRKIKGVPTIQGIEGYRGIVERMYRSGAVASVVVREVCENDEFDFVEGAHETPQHKVDWFNPASRGRMIGVYAYAKLTTGAVSRIVVLSEADVMAAKASSDGADSEYSPWNRLDAGKDQPQFKGRSMWLKTGARRLEPWVPTSAEYRREQLRASAQAVAVSERDRSAPAAPEPVDGEVIDDPRYGDPDHTIHVGGQDTGEAINDAQMKKMHATFNDLGITDRDKRLAITSTAIGRPVESANDLTKDEASTLINRLVDVQNLDPEERPHVIAEMAEGQP